MLSLPWPPSVNHYMDHAVGHKGGQPYVISYPSSRLKKYRSESAPLITRHRLNNDVDWPKEGPLQVKIEFYAPTARSYDLDNHAKAVLDSLTEARVWLDDKQIDRLLLERCELHRPNGMVRVTIADYVPRDEPFELVP